MDWALIWRWLLAPRVRKDQTDRTVAWLMKELGSSLIEGQRDAEGGRVWLLEARRQLFESQPSDEESSAAIQRLRGEVELLLGLLAEAEGRREDAQEHLERGLELRGDPLNEREDRLHKRAERSLATVLADQIIDQYPSKG